MELITKSNYERGIGGFKCSVKHMQQRVDSQGNPESDIKQRKKKPPKNARLPFSVSSTCDCHRILIDISTCNTSRGF